MSAPPYMPLFVGDYLADTTHLTCTEHGAYMLLLMSLWRNGGSLPYDDRTLARHARCTKGQWERMRPVLIEFFDVSDDAISHGRLTAELTRHSDAVERQAQRSSNGGKAKALKNKRTTPAAGTEKACQPEPEPETEEANAPSVPPPKAAGGVKRGSRIAPDWAPSPECQAYAEAQGLTPQEIDRATADFRDFWTARSGRDAAKLDWPATWRQRVRTLVDRKCSQGPAGSAKAGGHRPQPVSMAGLLAERRRQAPIPPDVPGEGRILRAV